MGMAVAVLVVPLPARMEQEPGQPQVQAACRSPARAVAVGASAAPARRVAQLQEQERPVEELEQARRETLEDKRASLLETRFLSAAGTVFMIKNIQRSKWSGRKSTLPSTDRMKALTSRVACSMSIMLQTSTCECMFRFGIPIVAVATPLSIA